jgi:predicted nucleic acid-binding protein
MHDFWPASGHPHLEPTPRGWLRPTDAWLRTLLALPELALVEESCPAEIALHGALVAAPSHAVAADALAAVADPDARANVAMFLGFRDALLAAGTLEAWYLALMRNGRVTVPPVFVDRVVQAIVRHLLDASGDAFEARAAEMLVRPQRITLADRRLLAADLATVDLLNETAGFGELGRLLVQGKAPLATVQMTVLGTDNAAEYWPRSARHEFVLDLTPEVASEVGHGLTFTLARAHSGLTALARVLERWLAHLLGVQVAITPLQKIADDAWRWHVGLDVESMALLNDLYEDRPVDADRAGRLISLFRLVFANPAEMRPDVAGKPVYLGLAMTAEGTLRLKPQNLLLNLPLPASM